MSVQPDIPSGHDKHFQTCPCVRSVGYRTGFVFGNRGCAFVSQQPGDVLLPQANVLPGDPQMIRLSGRSSLHA